MSRPSRPGGTRAGAASPSWLTRYRSTLEGLGMAALLAGAATGVVALHTHVRHATERELRVWADSAGLRIVAHESRFLRRGPLFFAMKDQPVFYVTVERTSDGARGTGYWRGDALLTQHRFAWDAPLAAPLATTADPRAQRPEAPATSRTR